MTKQEIAELKKLLTPKNCSITRICGCYVDGEKNKKTELKQAFLSLPEEEMFKYFEILRKALSGTIGKNLLTLNFPLNMEYLEVNTPLEEGTSTQNGDIPLEEIPCQEFFLRLRNSKLKDEALLEEYYNRIIDSFDYVGNYLILIVHDVYDVPGKTMDGLAMDDASDDVYEYILSCICPVNLSKPALSYDATENSFRNRVRDWIVEMPESGFLFPAFHDRGADIHSMLYYCKNPDELRESFAGTLLGCPLPLSAGNQKEAFRALVETTLGEKCDIDVVKNIHEKLNEMIEEHKEEPEPLLLQKEEVKNLFTDCGVEHDKLEDFDRHYDETAGEKTSLLIDNVANTRTFEVKTPDVMVKVNPERTDLIETQVINGKHCLVIDLSGNVEVNGITVKNITYISQ